ncbi:MAG: hypothetical protein ACI83O_000099 [Patescibacteria group bacterium]|jgi:hypothetical protein
MEIRMEVIYDSDSDVNIEASKLDRFRQAIFNQGDWRRTDNGGLEISL